MSIREAVPADVPAMLAIYAEYVTQTAVSFEYEVPSEAEFTRRLTEHTAVYPWLVWEEDNRVLGYCYAGRAFERAAYAWNAEISCYLAHEAQHRGIGRQLYARAVHIVGSFDRMEKELKNWDEFGLLRIGATPTLASVLLPKTLMTFEKRHPKLRVRCSVENGTHLQEALADDRLDFALVEGEVAAEHLHAEPFSEDRLILLLPPDDPRRNAPALTLRELAESPLLLREKGSMGRSFLDRVFAAHDLPLEPLMESISTHAIIQAVHAGLGISFLPQRLIRHSVESGFVATRAVDDEPFVRRNFAAWHEDKFLTRSARELLEDFRRCSADLCGDHARK